MSQPQSHVQPCHTQLCHIQPCHTQLWHMATQQHCHTQLCHIQLCHIQLCHTKLCHIHIVTLQPCHIHNLVTYTALSHTTLSHTQLCHTHTTLSHTHNFVTYNLVTHTTLSQSYNLVTHNFCHLTTSAFVSRSRRGTWQHLTSFYVAGVALMGLGWRWWCAWAPWRRGPLVWQVWHFATSAFVSRGRRGTWQHLTSFYVAGVAPMGLGWLWWCLGAVTPRPVAGVALGDIQLRFTLHAWYLWGWAGSVLYDTFLCWYGCIHGGFGVPEGGRWLFWLLFLSLSTKKDVFKSMQ